MRLTLSGSLYVLGGAAWAAAVVFGISQLLAYEGAAGVPAAAPSTILSATTPSPSAGPTLVLLVHPKCPCSRATIGELTKLMTDCRGRLTATVLMVRPAGAAAGWERTDLWESAAAIPGVNIEVDPTGERARQFGAATSGQALLYSADGTLLFAGGMTESRGHSGDNAGRAAITAMVLGSATGGAGARTPVFGCPLFDAGTSSHNETGVASCPK